MPSPNVFCGEYKHGGHVADVAVIRASRKLTSCQCFDIRHSNCLLYRLWRSEKMSYRLTPQALTEITGEAEIYRTTCMPDYREPVAKTPGRTNRFTRTIVPLDIDDPHGSKRVKILAIPFWTLEPPSKKRLLRLQ